MQVLIIICQQYRTHRTVLVQLYVTHFNIVSNDYETLFRECENTAHKIKIEQLFLFAT